ncbi:MAG: hypothetical protein H6721_07605 [Sandaracinus sp.]|nr:hypothetical protein [Myxococcales bacterium]MCB9631985.1 hypothetical protein [Sandaracinus sp.]
MRTASIVLSLLVAAPLVAQAPAEATEADLPGTYRLASSTSDAQQRVDAAIEAGVASMGPLRRSVGRRRLRAKNPIRRELVIALNGDRVSVSYDGERFDVRRGVRETVRLSDGEAVRLRATVEGARLTLHWQGDDGERRDTFTRRPDGSLVFGVTVTSEQLPNPVRYRLVYRRS